MIVVDASTLADFLLGRREAVDALRQELADRMNEPLHAPELIDIEALSALRKLSRAGAVSERRATEAAQDLAAVRLIRYPHAPLRDRVWQLRDSLTAYDAAYLALAEALDEPVLLTGDGGLAARACQVLGEDRVRHIA